MHEVRKAVDLNPGFWGATVDSLQQPITLLSSVFQHLELKGEKFDVFRPADGESGAESQNNSWRFGQSNNQDTAEKNKNLKGFLHQHWMSHLYTLSVLKCRNKECSFHKVPRLRRNFPWLCTHCLILCCRKTWFSTSPLKTVMAQIQIRDTNFPCCLRKRRKTMVSASVHLHKWLLVFRHTVYAKNEISPVSCMLQGNWQKKRSMMWSVHCKMWITPVALCCKTTLRTQKLAQSLLSCPRCWSGMIWDATCQ